VRRWEEDFLSKEVRWWQETKQARQDGNFGFIAATCTRSMHGSTAIAFASDWESQYVVVDSLW
jgi:hypothetical protein